MHRKAKNKAIGFRFTAKSSLHRAWPSLIITISPCTLYISDEVNRAPSFSKVDAFGALLKSALRSTAPRHHNGEGADQAGDDKHARHYDRYFSSGSQACRWAAEWAGETHSPQLWPGVGVGSASSRHDRMCGERSQRGACLTLLPRMDWPSAMPTCLSQWASAPAMLMRSSHQEQLVRRWARQLGRRRARQLGRRGARQLGRRWARACIHCRRVQPRLPCC